MIAYRYKATMQDDSRDKSVIPHEMFLSAPEILQLPSHSQIQSYMKPEAAIRQSEEEDS